MTNQSLENSLDLPGGPGTYAEPQPAKYIDIKLHVACKCLSLTLRPKETFSFNCQDTLEELPQLLADCNCFSMNSIHFSCRSKWLTTLFNWPVSPFKTSARAYSCNGLERCSPPALILWLLLLVGPTNSGVRPADPGVHPVDSGVCPVDPGVLLDTVEVSLDALSYVAGKELKTLKRVWHCWFCPGTVQLLRLLGSESNCHEFNMFISITICFSCRITRFTARGAYLQEWASI